MRRPALADSLREHRACKAASGTCLEYRRQPLNDIWQAEPRPALVNSQDCRTRVCTDHHCLMNPCIILNGSLPYRMTEVGACYSLGIGIHSAVHHTISRNGTPGSAQLSMSHNSFQVSVASVSQKEIEPKN